MESLEFNKHYIIEIEQYAHKIHVFISSTEFYLKEADKIIGAETTPLNLNGLGGAFNTYTNADGTVGSRYVWVRDFDYTLQAYRTLAHEFLHATTELMQDIGIPINRDNDEIMCYLQEYMCKKAHECLAKDLPEYQQLFKQHEEALQEEFKEYLKDKE